MTACTFLADLVIPPAALRWGRLTQPPPLEVTIKVDTSRFDEAMSRVAHSPAFERLAALMEGR